MKFEINDTVAVLDDDLSGTVTKIDGLLYEYACHEGNYAMKNILAGARAEEK